MALNAADFHPLDVKAGEWETTINGQTSGVPPIPDEMLKRLTPEQRAKIVEAIQSKGASGTKTVNKGCLRKEDLDKPFSLDSTKACSLTVVSSSGKAQEIHINCNQNSMKSTGTVKVEAVDSEHIKGEMHMTASNAENTMNMNSTFTSKWVGTCPGK